MGAHEPLGDSVQQRNLEALVASLVPRIANRRLMACLVGTEGSEVVAENIHRTDPLVGDPYPTMQ